MPGHVSPPEANLYCTMVFFLLAEVSFSFISYVGIATLCCLRYWGTPPPNEDLIQTVCRATPTAQTTNRQPPRWTGQDPELACHMPSRFPFPHLLASSTVPTNRPLHCVSPPMAANDDWATVSTHGGDPVASKDSTTHDRPRRAPALHSPRPANPTVDSARRASP